jgi:hypothetical protein
VPQNVAARVCSAGNALRAYCREQALAREVAQHKAIQQLASTFCKLTSEHIGSKWFQHFEAWLFARRVGYKSNADAVLPINAPSNHIANKELQRKLLATGMSKTLAESICLEMDRLPAHLMKRVRFTSTRSVMFANTQRRISGQGFNPDAGQADCTSIHQGQGCPMSGPE